MDEVRSWTKLRPLFESMLFDLGYQEVARRTELSVGTVYRLANADCRPQPRTFRDIRDVVASWLDAEFSHFERELAEQDKGEQG